MDRQYHVYIMASARHGTLYVGATGNLARRVWEHREGIPGSFTHRYAVTRLVHVEAFGTIQDAMTREKALKALAPGLEDRPDREHQPAVGRPLPPPCRLTRTASPQGS